MLTLHRPRVLFDGFLCIFPRKALESQLSQLLVVWRNPTLLGKICHLVRVEVEIKNKVTDLALAAIQLFVEVFHQTVVVVLISKQHPVKVKPAGQLSVVF